MDFIKRIQAHKVFAKNVLSHMLVLFVTLSATSLLYIKSIEVINISSEENTVANLTQFKISIDMYLENVEKLANLIELNDNVGIALNNADKSQSIISWTNKKISMDLEQIATVNSFIKQVGIYLPYDNVIITNQGAYATDNWFMINITDKAMSYTEYTELLNKYGKREYKVISTSKENEDRKVLFLSSLTSNNYKKSEATIIILFDFKSFTKFNNKQNTNTFIENGAKGLVFSNRYEVDEHIIKNNTLGRENYFEIMEIGKDKYNVTRLNSKINQWNYVSAIPLSEFEGKLEIIRTIGVLSFVLSLIIGIIISVITSEHSSQKLYSIVKLFGGEILWDKKDEYEYISGRIKELISEQAIMLQKTNEQNVIVCDMFLNRLIQGRFDERDNELFYTLKLSPKESKFVVMLIDIEKSNTSLLNKRVEGKEYTFIQGSISHIIKEIFEKEKAKDFKVFVTALEKMTACLFVQEDLIEEEDNFTTKIQNIAKRLKEKFKKELNVHMDISISSYHSGLYKCNDAYKEATIIMEYIKLVGINGIIKYGDLKLKESEIDTYYNATSGLFENYIKLEEYKKAKKVLAEIFEEQFNSTEISPIAVLKARMISLMNAFISAIRDLDMQFSYGAFQYLKPSTRLFKCNTIIENYTELEKLIDELEEYLEMRKYELKVSQKNLIKEFIEKNITDSNFSAAAIAHYFNITQPHLSRYFKKEFGIGILEYIHQLRVVLAKKYLEEDIPLREVAERAGFYNDIALIRVFKKYEKTTPKNYRDKIIKK